MKHLIFSLMLSLLSISTFAAEFESNEDTVRTAESECIMGGHFKKSEVESAIKDQSNYSKVEIKATWMTPLSPIEGLIALTNSNASENYDVDRYMDLNLVRDGVTHKLINCLVSYQSSSKVLLFNNCKDAKTRNFAGSIEPGMIDVSKLTPCS